MVSVIFLLYIIEKYRTGIEVVHRYIKEALYLSCVQVNSQYPVDANSSNKISDHFCGYRYPGLHLPVLPGISVIRDDGSDTTRRSPFQGIRYKEQFHDIVIDRHRGRLKDKNIRSPHILVQPYKYFTVAEVCDGRIPQMDAKAGSHFFSQFSMCGARNKL